MARFVRLFALAAVTVSSTASAAYTASVNGTTITFTGDSAGDSLVFTSASGVLKHQRFTAGDPGFESDLDFDSTTAGVQAAPAGATVVVHAGDGNDVVDASAAPVDCVFQVFGEAGDDAITGGAIGDTLSGGPGTDHVHGGPGNDTINWVDGDASDVLDGDDGADVVHFDGSASATFVVAITASGDRATVLRSSGSPFIVDVGTVENAIFLGSKGDDAFTVQPLAALPLSFDGNGATTSDVVTIDAGGTCPAVTGGSVTIAAKAPVSVTAATIAFSNPASAGALAFSAATYDVGIAAGSFDVPVTRTGGTCGPAAASFAAVGGTALSGGDYSLSASAVMFADGDTFATFPLKILAGATDGRTIDLVLANAKDGATLGAQATTTITLHGASSAGGGPQGGSGGAPIMTAGSGGAPTIVGGSAGAAGAAQPGGTGGGAESGSGGAAGAAGTAGASGGPGVTSAGTAGATITLPPPPHGDSSGCQTSSGDENAFAGLFVAAAFAAANRRRR